MKINIVSDLHLEFGDIELPGGDVLVLSGDICESKFLRNSKYDPENLSGTHGSIRRQDRAARFFEEECRKYQHVIYVMGNHEHYHNKLHKTQAELITYVPDNVQVLEQQTFQIEDVLFVGMTMWTDCNRGDPLTINHLKWGMNDYNCITYHDTARGVYRKLDPRDTVDIHFRSKQFLELMCEQNHDKKIVVCTHHAPTAQSIHEFYKHDTLMNGGYYSEFTEYLLDHPQIKLWTHGHVHSHFDYTVGETRVVCNPRGYHGHERDHGFDPTFIVEV